MTQQNDKNWFEDLINIIFDTCQKVRNNPPMLIVCKDKKYVMLKYNNEEVKIQCHEQDEFDWKIGFGLALSKMFGASRNHKSAREYFRDNETHKLNYKEYAKWCIYDIYDNLNDFKVIEDKVKEIEENGKVDL